MAIWATVNIQMLARSAGGGCGLGLLGGIPPDPAPAAAAARLEE